MSKNQDNYETAEEQKEAFRKVFAPLEDIRAKFEKKSVEEIQDSRILELAQYFCAAYQLIEQYQIQRKNLSDSSNDSEETKHEAIYLDKHSKPDTDKFIEAFDVLKTKLQVILNSNYGNCDINESFKTWIAAIKYGLSKLQKEDLNDFFSETPEVGKPLIKEEALFAFLGFKQFVETPIYQKSIEKIIDITDIPKKQESTIEICDKELSEETVPSNIAEPLQILDTTLDTVPITGSNLDGNDL